MSGVEPVAADSLQQENDAHQPDMEQPAEEKQATPPAEAEQLSDNDLASLEEEDQPIAADDAEAERNKLGTLQTELEQLQAQASEYLDGWQRARAEFANYRKRMEVEREELRRSSNEALLLKLLPVVDDFERAFQTLPEDLADTPWVNGITMILRKLQSVLETENVTPIQTAGQPFDPQWHQAILQEETTEHPDGYVTEEMQRGYRLGDRVLRPSMVKVASNQKETTSDEN
jgi:molecular chaperone GrpE